MAQYLLSVWHSDDNPVPDDPETMQKVFKQVDAFNGQLQSSGAWVVRRRPPPAGHGHGRA